MITTTTLSTEEKNRYARHLTLSEIGLAGQQQLKAAKVLVIGAGGLGCPVLQYLAAAGVGTIGILDSDQVEESNLQRQILYGVADMGQPKAEVACQKLKQQNPLVTYVPYVTRLKPANALSILKHYDLVIDGSDNFATRYLVNDACVLLDKPLVFGSVFRFEGQLSVFNYHGGPTYRCLYPEPGELPACAEAGVLGVLPGLVGCLMANETIKLITGIGQVLSGKLLLLNALSLEFRSFSFTADPENKNIPALPAEDLSCPVAVPLAVAEILPADLIDRLHRGQDLVVLDVREKYEYATENIGGVSLPLPLLEQHLDHIPNDRPVVVHCQSGLRSRKAAEMLVARGYALVFNLRGGLAALAAEEIDLLQRLLR